MKRAGTNRGLLWLALAGFLVVATGVIWRRTAGIAKSRQLQELERRREALENEKLQLEGSIRLAGSRARLVPRAERLGLKLPAASQVIIITRPPRPTSPPNGPQ